MSASAATRDGNNVAFSWQGNDEMDEAQGDGWPESNQTALSPDKSASMAATKLISSPADGLLQAQSSTRRRSRVSALGSGKQLRCAQMRRQLNGIYLARSLQNRTGCFHEGPMAMEGDQRTARVNRECLIDFLEAEVPGGYTTGVVPLRGRRQTPRK